MTFSSKKNLTLDIGEGSLVKKGNDLIALRFELGGQSREMWVAPCALFQAMMKYSKGVVKAFSE